MFNIKRTGIKEKIKSTLKLDWVKWGRRRLGYIDKNKNKSVIEAKVILGRERTSSVTF